MWLDLKKCTFVIFVITMFSLLAVQPAFSLESDFVSTGNSTVGVPTTTSYAKLLTNINDNPLKDNESGVEYRFGEVAGDRNKVILHQDGSDNILDGNGNFNIDFKIPKGYEFTFEIVIRSIPLSSDHYDKIEITIKDGEDKKITIDSSHSMGYECDYFLINKPSPPDNITIREKIPPGDGDWFINSSNDCDIHIEGIKGITGNKYPMEFYIIFNDSTA